MWIFAYGSLIRGPAIRFCDVRKATLRGYHRRFCVRSILGRGSAKAPGLMSGLIEGGSCEGYVFKLAAPDIEEETQILWWREMLSPA